MGQKRGPEQVVKSPKRHKRNSLQYVENGREFLAGILKNSGEHSSDSFSESSVESCVVDVTTSRSKAGMNESTGDTIPPPEITHCLGIDCEMVGVGPQRSSALARCSVVNYYGEVVFDAFVRPEQPVTDYRTKWSGVRESDLMEALSFKKARQEVKKIIKNCILIGHSVRCDLHALNIFHPLHLLRDTSRYHSIRSLAGLSVNNTPSLRDLASILLKQSIQDNEHCSIEDARATMSLYKLCEDEWEKELRGELSPQSYFSDLYWPSWTRAGNNV